MYRIVSVAVKWDDLVVGLSDDEQRILREIEQQLETDERFAQAVSPSGLYRHSVRTVRWAILGVGAGLVITVAALQVHFLVSFVGFLTMLLCGLVIERQVRLMGKAGVQDLAQTLRQPRFASARFRSRPERD
ncbi:MAG: DUF3040 domain-containing protein [Ilumatobacteraceae bacterium]|jgi:hypothetical protein|nr:DUF3040 domain-containing protein [Ilumatobacteraceae bacterium]